MPPLRRRVAAPDLTAGADWLLIPLLDYADATRDEAFLRAAVLPALTELARFYEDFLAVTDRAGQVVFAPSYSPEKSRRLDRGRAERDHGHRRRPARADRGWLGGAPIGAR